jgi:hypothetical protein
VSRTVPSAVTVARPVPEAPSRRGAVLTGKP